MKKIILIAFILLVPLSQSFASLSMCKDIDGFKFDGFIAPFVQISHRVLQEAARKMVTIAEDLYLSAEAEGKESIFPIQGQLLQAIYHIDASTRISQVAFNSKGEVVGFALGHFNPVTKKVSLEKFGVATEVQGQGVGKQLIHAFAQASVKAGAEQVELLVRKGNLDAIQIYEHWGFVNITPRTARTNPRFNAFAFAVLASQLVSKTAP